MLILPSSSELSKIYDLPTVLSMHRSVFYRVVVGVVLIVSPFLLWQHGLQRSHQLPSVITFFMFGRTCQLIALFLASLQGAVRKTGVQRSRFKRRIGVPLSSATLKHELEA